MDPFLEYRRFSDTVFQRGLDLIVAELRRVGGITSQEYSDPAIKAVLQKYPESGTNLCVTTSEAKRLRLS